MSSLSVNRQNGTQRYSSARTTQRALLTPKYHSANTTYHSRNMFCINKIEIQGRTKELQTQISGTAPQQLIVQGKLISLPRQHYYSTILTFFFFFDFSDDCGTSEVVLLCTPCAWDPWEALPDMHVWVPQAAFILSLLLVFGSRLCAPLAQWTGWALAAPVLRCTRESRLSLPRRTWEATRESQFNQMSLSCGYNDWVANWPLSKLTAFCLRDASYWQKCISSPLNSKIHLNK